MSIRPAPDLEAEQEVDLGRYASTVAARWWLPLAAILLGALAGYALSVGGGNVYKAEALLYLGQPFSPNGGAPVQALATNPRTVGEIVRSESALKRAAAASGIRVGKLRGKISTEAITSTPPRAGQTPLVQVEVQGAAPLRVAKAANTLARVVVERVSVYVDTKIRTYDAQLEVFNQALASIQQRVATYNRAIENERLSLLEQLILVSQIDNAEQRRVGLLNQQTQTQQLLALAHNVERADVVERAEPVKTTARSTRNSVVVGALLGLLVGLLAALAWDALAARTRRSAAA
jgi:uncharacterized protein involved in exopolysaccharide biosynthesis